MAKGRKKIPDVIKIGKGTFQPCRSAKTAETQSSEELRLVKWESEDPQDYFDILKDSLTELQLNSDSYSLLVSLTAYRCADMARIRAEGGNEGAISNAFKDIRSALTEFRLTPSSIGSVAKKKEHEKQGFGGL